MAVYERGYRPYEGGFGFHIEPGTTDWWLTRPIWIGVLIVLEQHALLGLIRRKLLFF